MLTIGVEDVSHGGVHTSGGGFVEEAEKVEVITPHSPLNRFCFF